MSSVAIESAVPRFRRGGWIFLLPAGVPFVACVPWLPGNLSSLCRPGFSHYPHSRGNPWQKAPRPPSPSRTVTRSKWYLLTEALAKWSCFGWTAMEGKKGTPRLRPENSNGKKLGQVPCG